jgi:hypothetical protein
MTACKHWWRIDTPAGTYSAGRCKRCGETRDNFLNVEPSLLHPSDFTHSAKSARDAARKRADQRRRGVRLEVGA